MSEQDDERWITERFDGGGSCADDMRAAIARGYERGKAEGTADRDRLAKRVAELERVVEFEPHLGWEAAARGDQEAGANADRLAALEQRVGELVEITRGCVDESIEEQDALARLAALRAPGMGSDVDVQRDRADRLAVLVDGLRGTLERTRAEIEALRARVGGARWLLATAHITESLTPKGWLNKRSAWLDADLRTRGEVPR